MQYSELFQEEISSTSEEELEELKNGCVTYLLNNPFGGIFFIFGLSKFRGNS
jgi:hypothetical protein